MNDQPKDRRTKAIENLLHLYLTDDCRSGGKRVTVLVSERNSCSVEFVSPPSKAEIDATIEYLTLTRKFCGEVSQCITLERVNEALAAQGLAPIEKHPDLDIPTKR